MVGSRWLEEKEGGEVKVFLLALVGLLAGAAVAGEYVRPDIAYVDGCETIVENPGRGLAPGGWVTFKPEGMPNWHGQGGYHSSLWELSRFSGGREQGGKRPSPERVGGKDIPLTAAVKNDVERFLTETRGQGGTLIVRLGYTWSEQPGCEPFDFEILLGHIRDLSSIIAKFPEVRSEFPKNSVHFTSWASASHLNLSFISSDTCFFLGF